MPVETLAIPQPGQIVRVRQRLYLVEAAHPPAAAEDSTRLVLACVDDDAQGQELEVLWEHELDGEILKSEDWAAIAQRGFDTTERFAAYWNTLRWNCVTATDPTIFQSPFRAGIRLDAYQLEPLRKALRLPRANLFIADDVGVGKTIEAGLILRELLLRKRADYIVVACPASMLQQWREELAQRFGLSFVILDRQFVQSARQEFGFGSNPWSTHSRFLISHRLLIDSAYTQPLLDCLGQFRPASVLVLDEAHHAAPSSGQRYAIDSQITRAVRDLAPRFEHRLFLSATPHNGHSNSFSALLELLDPQRFIRGAAVSKSSLEAVMVRRLKEDLRELQGGFPQRVVDPVVISGLSPDAPELRLAALLDTYRTGRRGRLAGSSKQAQTVNELLLSHLQHRLLSSIEAFARTLRVHRRQAEKDKAKAGPPAAPAPVQQQFDLLEAPPGADDDRAELSPEDLAAEEEAQVEAASDVVAEGRAAQYTEEDMRLLEEMRRIADESRGEPDARVLRLVEWIRENMCPDLGAPGAKWNGRRLILFTEWEDTLGYLQRQLQAVVADSHLADERIDVFRGRTCPAEREAIKAAFNEDPAKAPIRILICTDAAREGLNLQAHCQDLFHFDLPWNPARLEQRNGRIDRKLQPAPVVHCRYFIYKDRPEDRVLAALVRKTETIRRELGSVADVLDDRLHRLIAPTGIQRDRVEATLQEIESAGLDADHRAVVEEELEATRERRDKLEGQIDRLRNLLEQSRRFTGDPHAGLPATLSSALQLVGAGPLRPTAGPEGSPERYTLPPLDRREAADPSWAETMDALRAPRARDQSPAQWRAAAPIRPVVFEDPGVMTEDVVQLHLEHPLARRLLGRLLAQGFAYHDLSRACLAQSEDAIPRVLLIGRLALYGAGAARLHEELIAVGARWQDPARRSAPLAPYARDGQERALELLERALASRGGVAEEVAARLRAAAPRDIAELFPHLEARGATAAREAGEELAKRAEIEARDMRAILEAQRKHLEAKIADHDREAAQQRLHFAAEEWRQVEANRRYWAKRLPALEEELAAEPARIRAVYDVKAQRLEPVGLVYLWPVTG